MLEQAQCIAELILNNELKLDNKTPIAQRETVSFDKIKRAREEEKVEEKSSSDSEKPSSSFKKAKLSPFSQTSNTHDDTRDDCTSTSKGNLYSRHFQNEPAGKEVTGF